MNARVDPKAFQGKSTAVAERAILGGLLINPSLYFDVAELLDPVHFSRPFHGMMFAAMGEILKSGNRLGLQVLTVRLGEEYEDGKSTINYLTALMREVQSAETAFSPLEFVSTLTEEYRRRALAETAQWLGQELNKPAFDSSDILDAVKERISAIALQGQSVPVYSIGHAAERALRASHKAQSEGVVYGFDTGLRSLDEILGRIFPTDFGIILAAQGDGKTVLAQQLCRRAQVYAPSLLFELEMDDEDLARRALAGEANMGVAEIEAGTYEIFGLEDLNNAVTRLKAERFYIDDRPRIDFEEIRDRCTQMKNKSGLGMVAIDHLRLVRTRKRFNNKFDRGEWLTGELKAMAKELKIAVVGLSQRTRGSQRRDDCTPHLDDSDLGPSVEQDVDWALGMARRDVWLNKRKPVLMPGEDPSSSKEFLEWLSVYQAAKGRVELTTLKRRRGDVGETRQFLFNGRAGRIEELDE